MVKYKFHEWKDRISKDPTTQLPEDINAPMEDFVKKIGCARGVEKLVAFRKNVRYAKMRIEREDNPNTSLTIHVNSGMADLRVQDEVEIVDGWKITTSVTTKNSKLDKQKE